MEALTCEICGGKLIGKAGGTFECESCGMSFDKKRIIELVHEIKGTVKVEQTLRVEQNVNVNGTVKVEGGLNAENYIKRGNICLQDRKWEEAKLFFHQALNYDPENGEAYLGLAQADMRIATELSMSIAVSTGKALDNSNYRKAKKYSQAIADRYQKYEIRYHQQKNEAAALRRAREEEAARQREEEAQKVLERRKKYKKQYGCFQGMIAACEDYTVAVRADGTVQATDPKNEFCNRTENWYDMVAVAADTYCVVGLRADGTVLANTKERIGHSLDYLYQWESVTAIASGSGVTAGLKANGTVYLDCEDKNMRRTVESWRNIQAVSISGYGHVLGLKNDGTVEVAGENKHDECSVSCWKKIVAVTAGKLLSAGLDLDGNVYTTGLYSIDTKNWKDIVSIAAGTSHLIGLKADGTVVAAGKNEYGACAVNGWKDIVSIVTTNHHTVGLRSDGTVVATKFITDGIYTDEGQSNVSNWRLFQSADTLQKERKEGFARTQAVIKERKAQFIAELAQLKKKHDEAKGLFAGSKRKKLLARIDELETELKGMR